MKRKILISLSIVVLASILAIILVYFYKREQKKSAVREVLTYYKKVTNQPITNCFELTEEGVRNWVASGVKARLGDIEIRQKVILNGKLEQATFIWRSYEAPQNIKDTLNGLNLSIWDIPDNSCDIWNDEIHENGNKP